jgi:hypothetical protein
MSEAWANFGILLFVQFLIFIAVALYEKKTSSIKNVLWKGILIGIPFGLSFDLVLGKLLGLSSYALGFGLPFLLPNAAFSYGFFAATILLLRQQPLPHFFLVTLVITALYEFVNLFLGVWEWQFPIPPLLYPVVLAVGYIVGAILVVRVVRLFPIKVP